MMSSVNTNVGAMVALSSLNATTAELQKTQKAISTGYRVADATDDGAAFAVAERIRGDVAATTSANQMLAQAKGVLTVTNTALSNVSETLKNLKAVTVKLADATLQADQRSQYQAQAKQLSNNIKAFITNASYNGNNIINDPATTLVQVVNDGSGAYYTFQGYKAVTNIFNVISASNTWTRGDASKALTATGAVNAAMTATLTQLNAFGSYTNYVDTQITYNNATIDAQTAGLGALIDADMAKESAKLQALQIRQQLGSQALSIANQSPQMLLSLFKG